MGLELKLAGMIKQVIGIGTLSFSIVFWEFFIGGILINAIYKLIAWPTDKVQLKYTGLFIVFASLAVILAFVGPKAYGSLVANWLPFVLGNLFVLCFWGLAELAHIGIFRNEQAERWDLISLIVGLFLIFLAIFIFYQSYSCSRLTIKSADLKNDYENAKHLLLGSGIMSFFTGGLLIGLCFEKARTVFRNLHS